MGERDGGRVAGEDESHPSNMKVIPVEDWNYLLCGWSDKFAISCTETGV